MAEINAELAQAQVESSLSIQEITDIDQYKAYREQYVTELKTLLQESGADMNKYTDSVLEDMADAYLTGYSNIATIIEENDIMGAIKEKTSLDSATLDKVAADYKDFFTISKHVEFDKI
jgi:ActR/RegA family two-component response regulator